MEAERLETERKRLEEEERVRKEEEARLQAELDERLKEEDGANESFYSEQITKLNVELSNALDEEDWLTYVLTVDTAAPCLSPAHLTMRIHTG